MPDSPPAQPRYRLPTLSLTRAEIDELEAFLRSKVASASLQRLDVLHGFLTCVALSASDIAPGEWLPLVWRDTFKGRARDHRYAQEKRLTSYVLRMLDDIVLSLADPDQGFCPLVARVTYGGDQTYADGSMWCSGFLLGMAHLADHWRGLLDKPDAGCLILPIFLLGSPFLPPLWEEMVETLDQRARLTLCLPTFIEAIHVQRFALEVRALQEARKVLAWAQQVH